MRAGIGLVALLIAAGLIFYLFAESELPKIKAGKEAEKQVQQYAGYGNDSMPATESFTTSGKMRGSKLAALQVTGVTPGGAMDSYYGLKPGDEIIQIGDMTLDVLSSDEETAKTLVVSEGFQKQKPITVRRGSHTMSLPAPAGASPPAAASPPTAAVPDNPPAAAAAPATLPYAPRKPGGLERQLQGIQDAAGGGQSQ